jgi:hypothetical protein
VTAESELWACRVCKSINSRRSNRCYSCHTPREAAEIKPQDMPTVGEMPAIEHSYTYSTSEMRAVFLSLATAIFIMGSLVVTYLLWQAASHRVAGRRAESQDLYDTVIPFLPILPALAAVALLAYAAWISRVVGNLPALGLGYSRVSSTMAFIEPLIPGFNLYALPARIGEVLGKLDKGGNGLPLLGLAWVLFVVPVAFLALAIRVSMPGSRFDYLFDLPSSPIQPSGIQTITFTLFLGVTIQAMALLIGLFLVWKVERLSRTLAASRSTESRAPAQRA